MTPREAIPDRQDRAPYLEITDALICKALGQSPFDPGARKNNAPCSSKAGAPYYENQCAIRLGIALKGAGVSLTSYTGSFCWHKHGRSHPLRANDLARWLDTVHFVKKAEVARRTSGQNISVSNYAGRSGIVMWMNFWGSNNQGDHIDLWNGVRIAHGDLDYFARSEEVRFWAIS